MTVMTVISGKQLSTPETAKLNCAVTSELPISVFTVAHCRDFFKKSHWTFVLSNEGGCAQKKSPQ